VRILHISDLHASSETDSDKREILTAALTDISAEGQRTRFDLVVFSGDLSSDGSAAALVEARRLLLDPLAEMLPGCEVILTPGNHDVNLKRINPTLETGLQHELLNQEVLDALQSDPNRLREATSRLEDWNAFTAEYYAGVGSRSAIGPAAFMHRLTHDDCTVAVAVLDSAWRASGGAKDRSLLMVGEKVVREALDAIDDAQLRLVVVHHPLTWLAEFDSQAIRKLFETRGLFVLSGHEHTADPTIEMTTRGAALYSRAGCLYAGPSYSNSYTILDLDTVSHSVRVTVRRWWPKREEFDVASDFQRGGTFTLPWPTRANALPAHRTSFSEVLSPLAQIAQEQSLIAGDLAISDSATVSDLLIAPRFWPVPNREAIDNALPEEKRPKPVDPLASLKTSRVLLVSGEHSAGVTSALLWILEQHFRLYGTVVPAYMRADERFSLGRLNHAVAGTRSLIERGEDGTPPPVLLAVDDVVLSDPRARGRLRQFLDENPEVIVILGCHDDQHTVAAGILESHGVSHERVFLAPFGRREMRQLVMRIAGPDSGELVRRVLNVIHGQGLARNPLNVAALVAVVTREEDLTELNESGLLQSYVTILLENPVAIDPEGLAMDYRRREFFLSKFAAHLLDLNLSRIPRGATEQFVLDYFDSLGWRSASAGQLIDSLIRRRVLTETTTGVGFRYAALLYLFAAKAAMEDEDFGTRMLADPVRYANVVRHTAGLRRSDAKLLATVGKVTDRLVGEAVPGLDVGQFDLMTDKDGWSQITDLDDVRQLVHPVTPEPTEEELDEFYEEVAEDPDKPETPEAFPVLEPASALERMAPPVELLASVLKSSELVADVALKTRLVRQLIEAWSRLSILLAVREDETQELRRILERLFSDVDDEAKRSSAAEHYSRVLVVTFMTFGLYANAGSKHIQIVMERLLDEEEFMSQAANALLASMLYAMLGFPGWPERLGKLHELHPRHPMVGEVARRWALRSYVSGSLDARVQEQLEGVLVAMLMPANAAPTGPRKVGDENQIRERLKRSRTRARWKEDEQDGNEGDVLRLTK
jgi:predicted MPP superfamily phosphohydrolase